jgi:hypothetical protein
MNQKIMKLREKPIITGKPDDRFEVGLEDNRIRVPEYLEHFIDEDYINQNWAAAREDALENIESEIKMYMEDLQNSFHKRDEILKFFNENK